MPLWHSPLLEDNRYGCGWEVVSGKDPGVELVKQEGTALASTEEAGKATFWRQCCLSTMAPVQWPL